MTDPIVVTNLRLPKSDLAEVRNIAGELGMSVNEFFKCLVKAVSVRRSFVNDLACSQKRDPIWDLPELAKMPNKPMGKLSDEDEVIYGV